ncbi:unnamed protein product [Allacma fusca]|uniref:RNase H type-1 domain-containing protein n=1 Tax=Allacma fusca TaxID=39272 RepID=A0A8J2P9B9_9HEXA|nr:unnamed protein product [Allacma fusca]
MADCMLNTWDSIRHRSHSFPKFWWYRETLFEGDCIEGSRSTVWLDFPGNSNSMDKGSPDENGHNRNDFGKQNGVPYAPRYYGHGRGNQQVEFQHHGSYPFHMHSQPYRSRGHPRMAPWMRSRFTNPNQVNGDSYYNPRMFYGRGGHGRGIPRDGSHQGIQQFSSYRGVRRHKPNHAQAYQPSPNYYNNYHRMNQSSEEYIPYNFMSNSHMFPPQHDRCLLPNGCEIITRNVSPSGYYTPVLTGYSPKSTHVENQEENVSSNLSVVPYCPENFQMSIPSVDESSTTTPEVSSMEVSTDGTPSRRLSTDSTDDSSSSFLTSDSSSDGYDNEDSGVSTFDASDGDDKTVSSPSFTENISGPKDGTAICSSYDAVESVYPQNDINFMSIYIQVRSSNIIDGRGNTSPDELACYGVWFGFEDKRNMVEEVNTKYNQDRGRTGYILGVIKALEIIKEEGYTNRIHFIMGSPFIMNNLSSWVTNLKCENACSTNWTEWKHFNEINQLLGVIDGMMMKFSLAHPRDKSYVLCKESVSLFWNEMKMRKLLVSPPLSPHSSKLLPAVEDDHARG